ncbi:MAG: hypothetical protein QNJ36_06515 [Calothrix sp. MO_167.B42]|nr:hypothetical protein [Calothrix sp. MO_167.B42]
MANIKVNDIKPAGTQLFNDSESFLEEITEEFVYIQGGSGHQHDTRCGHGNCKKTN